LMNIGVVQRESVLDSQCAGENEKATGIK